MTGTRINEDARRQFESALRSDVLPSIDTYLPDCASVSYADTLEELVIIELEYRWKKGNKADEQSGSKLGEYLDRFPALMERETLQRLIDEEMLIRTDHGSQPTLEEYRSWLRSSHSTLSDTPPSPSFCITNRYVTKQTHGEGGMGTVFRAVDERLQREVAVKQLRKRFQFHPESRQRFFSEAQLAARLDHPGVVPVYDLGIDDEGAPCYAMKLVRGRTLRRRIEEIHESTVPQSERRVEFRALLGILLSVSRTVSFAHSRHVLHRDLKPDNIIVGDFGETTLLDWGLAKSINLSDNVAGPAVPSDAADIFETQLGAVLGTPAYMSPEQAAGNSDDVDERTDVYALGAILFHMLAGRPQIQSAAELPQLMNRSTPLSPRSINPSLEKSLDAICARATAVASRDRYQTVDDFCLDLEHFLADEPVTARREAAWEQLMRKARRHRTLVTGLVVASGMLIAAAAVVYDQDQKTALEEKREADVALSVVSTERRSAAAAFAEGRFETAGIHLTAGIERAKGREELHEQRQQMLQDREEASSLVAFQQTVRQAEELGFFEEDEDAIQLCDRNLHRLGVYSHADWWNYLARQPLNPDVEDQLRVSVYQHMTLVVALRLKRGLLTMSSPLALLTRGNEKSRAIFARALASVEAAERFQRSEGLSIATALCRHQLGETAGLPLLSDFELRNGQDEYFIGLALLFYSDDVSNPLAQTVLEQIAGIRDSLGKARSMLSNAMRKDPRHFWAVYSYGWAEELSGNYERSAIAYSLCTALRPDHYFGYLNRAQALMYRAEQLVKAEPARYRELVRDALQDIERAASLAPGEYDVRWWQAGLHARIGGNDLARLEAGIALGEVLSHQFQEENYDYIKQKILLELESSRAHAADYAATHPDSAEAWLAQAICLWRMRKHDDVAEPVAKAIGLRPNWPTALAVRGFVEFGNGHREAAEDSFQKAVNEDTSNFIAQRGLAEIASLTDPELAVSRWLTTYALAKNVPQKLHCLKGQVIGLLQQEKSDAAMSPLATLLDLRPAEDLSAIVEAADRAGASRFLEHLKLLTDSTRYSPTRTPSQSGDRASLLNGDFELSLDRYWRTTQATPTVWWNEGGAQAAAQLDDQTFKSGTHSLRIRHESLSKESTYGRIIQPVSVDAGATYRIDVDAKGLRLEEDSICIVVSNNFKKPVVSFPSGTWDWKALSGEFTAAESEVSLQVVSKNRGTVWIDNLTVTLVRSTQ